MEKKYDYKNHWNNAYNNNSINELGWYEDDPKASFDLIEKCKISNDSMVFLAGAGSSLLIGLLLKKGYNNLHVNDISSSAINSLKSLIGDESGISYIIDDLTNPKELCNLDM